MLLHRYAIKLNFYFYEQLAYEGFLMRSNVRSRIHVCLIKIGRTFLGQEKN